MFVCSGIIGITTESVDTTVSSHYWSSQHGSTGQLTSWLSCSTSIFRYLWSFAKSMVSVMVQYCSCRCGYISFSVDDALVLSLRSFKYWRAVTSYAVQWSRF